MGERNIHRVCNQQLFLDMAIYDYHILRWLISPVDVEQVEYNIKIPSILWIVANEINL